MYERHRLWSADGTGEYLLAVATRYDKRCYIYLGTTTAAALVIWLRS